MSFGDIEILFVNFNAYEIPVGIQAGYTSCAAPHDIIEDPIVFIGVGLYKILEKQDGFLRTVQTVIVIDTIESQNV